MAVKKLGELLVESGLITSEQLDQALREGKEGKGVRLGTILVKKGFASEIDIAQTLSFQLNIPFVDISATEVDPEAIKLVSESLAKKYLIVPICKEGKVLNVAMTDPLNLHAIDDLRFSTSLDIKPNVATLSDVTEAISRHYHMNEPMEDLIGDFNKDKLVEIIHDADMERDISENLKKSAAPPIIRMVDSIIIHAVDNGASDIHLEPQEKSLKFRERVDGLMKETMQLPKWVQGPVVSRIKLMARMDISERRVSQDGRIKVRLENKSLDIRVSTLPTQHGETVVLRILDPKASLLDVRSIGLFKEDGEQLLDMIERPQGVVIVTGPTGSGKTSTLYSMVGHIKREEINIITIEDPIEYEFKGVNQVSINEKTGLTFSYTLRSVLRQDPDVIMVGEMRDTETAMIAIQASLTGHLVFSTLHTNDAVSSIIRLKNMGVPPYMAASSLNGIVSQRLVRKICAQCREQYTPKPEDIKKTGIKWSGKHRLWRGAGCNKCKGSGYSGRIGVFEVLRIDKKLRDLISSDAAEPELMKAALESGMTTLQADGFRKVSAGLTTLDELMRVVYLSRDRGDEEGNQAVCHACMKHIGPDAESCPYCGELQKRTCLSCGKSRQPGWVICPFCASKFDNKSPV